MDEVDLGKYLISKIDFSEPKKHLPIGLLDMRI